jgi:TonB family protein
MAYHFAQPALLSRRAIAAASIVALHLFAAYLLATGLVQTMDTRPSTVTVGVLIPNAKPAPPPPVRLIDPSRFEARLEPVAPASVIDVPEVPVPDRVGAEQALSAPVSPPLVYTLRLIGKHLLPNSEDYYPPDLRRLGVEGATDVRVCVDESGVRQGEPLVEKSSGNARLDAGAVNVARHGRYARSVRGSAPVANCYRFRIVFRMK